ncbi:unnamed protein product [Cylicocyclus nassatus]|uniref:Uncharacterized protein n=1 Tax=Cylicocyclus nassatus TaxID=53992 RepID=A0AA36GYK8_CYLNA|nr:unnamed protein product [Cylicocyclus nassatus]
MSEDFVIALKGLTDEQYYEWALVRLLLDDGYPSSEIPFMIESCKLTDMALINENLAKYYAIDSDHSLLIGKYQCGATGECGVFVYPSQNAIEIRLAQVRGYYSKEQLHRWNMKMAVMSDKCSNFFMRAGFREPLFNVVSYGDIFYTLNVLLRPNGRWDGKIILNSIPKMIAFFSEYFDEFDRILDGNVYDIRGPEMVSDDEYNLLGKPTQLGDMKLYHAMDLHRIPLNTTVMIWPKSESGRTTRYEEESDVFITQEMLNAAARKNTATKPRNNYHDDDDDDMPWTRGFDPDVAGSGDDDDWDNYYRHYDD